MPLEKVRPGWTGKTKDQVVAKLDWIPEEVRTNPRPYLEIHQKYETEAIVGKRGKVQRVATYAPAPTPPKSQLQRFSLPVMLSPPVMPESFGQPTFIAINLIKGSVEYKYENGGLVRESLLQQVNTSSTAMAATRPTAARSKKRTAPVDDAESDSSATPHATMPPPLKRQIQARPEIRTEATMYEQANDNGKLEDQVGVQDDVAVEREEAWHSVDNDGSHGGVKLEML